MKRNKLFLLGLFVVFAAVLSLSLVSSTFAKYTTAGTGEDTARVAKWGVTVTVAGDETAITEIDGTAEAHVITNTGELLAPGTAGKLGQVAISGTPEVDVRVSYTATVLLENWTVGGAYYCPIVVKVNGTQVTAGADAAAFAANIKAAIEAITNDYDTDDDLSTASDDLLITWEWAYEGDNVKDTALGDAANAGTNIPKITVTLTASVTQID